MFTEPHLACLLAAYLMDMTIVITKSGWKYVDKPGTIYVDDFEHYSHHHNNEWPPSHTIGRISIMYLPKSFFSPTTATGVSLRNYLQGPEQYVPIDRSILKFHPTTTPQHLHTTPLNPVTD